jgi:hypothetical protein
LKKLLTRFPRPCAPFKPSHKCNPAWASWLFVLALMPMPAHSGPFGLSQGMSLQQLARVVQLTSTERHGWFATDKLPASNSYFERYDLLIDPKKGLCKIVATGKTLGDDAAGSQLTSQFRAIEATVSRQNGIPSRRFDFVRPQKIPDDSHSWMLGLWEGRRSLDTFWSATGSPENARLQAIYLSARASSVNSGWVFLIYEFKGADECNMRSEAPLASDSSRDLQ